MALPKLFQFPNPVNEISARLVATGVVGMAAGYLVTGWTPILWVLAYGFVARVLTGPTLSPLGQLVTRVITPALNLESRPTAGPPKRFAQGMGVAFSVSALLATVVWDTPGASQILIGMLVVAASLEAFAGICLGCITFAGLMRVGIIPESVCLECADISRRLDVAETRQRAAA